MKFVAGQEKPLANDSLNLLFPKKTQSQLFDPVPKMVFSPKTGRFIHKKRNFLNFNRQPVNKNIFNKLKPYYAPAALLTLALYSVSDEASRDSPFDKYAFQNDIQNNIFFRSNIDDYLRHAPLAITAGLKLAGVKGRSDGLNTAILAAKSFLLVDLVVTRLKRTTKMERPDKSSYTSFPSAHTATAFCNATIMHMEFKDESIWYSIAAYSMASVTGAMRIVNNKHWLPDVLAGAAIGMLVPRIVYATHRYRWGEKPANLFVAPTYSNRTLGLKLSYKF